MGSAKTSGLWAIYAVGAALVITAILSAFSLAETDADRALLAARYTARAGFLAFLPVYLAGPGVKLWPNAATRWLARRPRHLGIAFALVMILHLVALGINVTQFAPRTISSMVPGAVTYAFIILMALTSTDAAQRRMGKWWRRMHTAGLHLILIVFTVSYASRLGEADRFVVGVIFTPIALSLVAVRLWQRASANRTRRVPT